MSALQVKLLFYGGLAVAAWWLTSKPKPPIADVELGVPTLNGIYGADTYYSDAFVAGPGGAPAPAVPPVNPAVDPRMRALIDQSNAAIAADNGDYAITR